MHVLDWLHLFFAQLKETSFIEWLGVTFGVAEVLYAKANKIWLYPCGIISVVLSSYIFIISGLYAESLLNMYYLVMSIYGWWYWIKKRTIHRITRKLVFQKDWMVTVAIVAVALQCSILLYPGLPIPRCLFGMHG